MQSGKLIAVLQGSTSPAERKATVESTSYAGLMAAKHILTARKGCPLAPFSILRIECELIRRDRLAAKPLPAVRPFTATVDVATWAGADRDEMYTRDYYNSTRWLRRLGVWAS